VLRPRVRRLRAIVANHVIQDAPSTRPNFGTVSLSFATMFTPSRSQIPDLRLSPHPARAIARRLPPSTERRAPPGEPVGPKISHDDPPPSLHNHYSRFITNTRQSAPLRRIGTFGLAVGAACAFSVGIAGFHVPYQSLVELCAAYTPDAARAVSVHLPS